MKGWIKLHKKIQENPLWTQKRELSKFEAWIWILMNAHGGKEPLKILAEGEILYLKRGELCFSIRFMQTAWNWKSTKKVFNFISFLEKNNSIRKKKETGRTHITICNYESYNPLGNTEETLRKQEGNTKETLRKQEGNKDNEVKEVNEVNEVKESVTPTNEKDKNLIEKIGLNQFRIFAELPAFHSLEIARKDLLIDWLQHKSKINDQYRTDYQAQSILKTFCTDYTFDELRQLVNWSTTGGRSYKNLLFDRLERVQKKSSKITANGKDNFSKYWS
jgi:hypothetical protein